MPTITGSQRRSPEGKLNRLFLRPASHRHQPASKYGSANGKPACSTVHAVCQPHLNGKKQPEALMDVTTHGEHLPPAYAYTFENAAVREAYGAGHRAESCPTTSHPTQTFDMAMSRMDRKPIPGWNSLLSNQGRQRLPPPNAISPWTVRTTPLTPSDVGFRYLLPLLPEDFVHPEPALTPNQNLP